MAVAEALLGGKKKRGGKNLLFELWMSNGEKKSCIYVSDGNGSPLCVLKNSFCFQVFRI